VRMSLGSKGRSFILCLFWLATNLATLPLNYWFCTP
jgi:hypothetical protein